MKIKTPVWQQKQYPENRDRYNDIVKEYIENRPYKPKEVVITLNLD